MLLVLPCGYIYRMADCCVGSKALSDTDLTINTMSQTSWLRTFSMNSLLPRG